MIDGGRLKAEDDWFLKNERELLEAARVAREKREKERAELERSQELERIKAAHFMKCPKCGHDMATEDDCGVEIDRCSHCEGIFLDAGELEDLFLKRNETQRRSFMRKLLRI
jgi:ribosomal protein L32